MAFDNAANHIVVFGGGNLDGDLADTWIWH
jgi:hypothetical protein